MCPTSAQSFGEADGCHREDRNNAFAQDIRHVYGAESFPAAHFLISPPQAGLLSGREPPQNVDGPDTGGIDVRCTTFR